MDVTVSQYRLHYRSLAIKMVLAIVMVAVVPLVLMAGLGRRFVLGAYNEQVQDRLEAIAGKQQQAFDTFITERLNALRLAARSNSIAGLTTEAGVRGVLEAMQGTYGGGIIGLGVLNGTGRQAAYAWSPECASRGLTLGNWTERALTAGFVVTDLISGPDMVPHFILAVTMNRDDGQWVLAAAVSAESAKAVLRSFFPGGSGTVMVVDGSGAFQFGTSPALGVEDEAVRRLRSSIGPAAGSMAIGGNNDGALVCMGIRLTYADWVLFLLQERQELSGTVNEARLYSVSTLLLGVLGILAFSIVVSKRLARHVAHLDQEKQLMNEQLIRAGKLASLGEMAAGIAHEINNPVGIMIQEAGWIQDLLDEAEQGVGDNMDEFREAARKIQLHGKRCRDITHKLLRFARGAPPALEQVQLNQLIEDVIALCQQRARLSGVEINRSLAEDMPEVNVTPSEVQQVLVNLINNSLDAMEEAGRMIEIISKTRGNYAAVDVGDTGPGISQRDIGRIFDPFFTTKPVGKGTGLGLSICYGIMKKMKGDITVTSTEGQGTTFHLLFPLAAEGR